MKKEMIFIVAVTLLFLVGCGGPKGSIEKKCFENAEKLIPEQIIMQHVGKSSISTGEPWHIIDFNFSDGTPVKGCKFFYYRPVIGKEYFLQYKYSSLAPVNCTYSSNKGTFDVMFERVIPTNRQRIQVEFPTILKNAYNITERNFLPEKYKITSCKLSSSEFKNIDKKINLITND